MRTLKVAEFRLWPNDELTHYQVGFSYTTNGRNGYNDITIPRDELIGKTDEQIVQLAYERLKTIIEENMVKFESRSPLLGAEIPVTGMTIEEPVAVEQVWDNENRDIRVIVSDDTLKKWMDIASKDTLMGRVTEVTQLLEYYKMNRINVVERDGVNYLYLEEIYPEHQYILENNGGIIDYRDVTSVSGDTTTVSGDTTNYDNGE